MKVTVLPSVAEDDPAHGEEPKVDDMKLFFFVTLGQTMYARAFSLTFFEGVSNICR